MSKSFIGGIKIYGRKQTRSRSIKNIEELNSVSIPLFGANGIPCRPNVSVGERVYVGQMIGMPVEEPCCPVFASVSGFVREIETRTDADGAERSYVVIDNDYKEDFCDHIRPHNKALLDTSNEEFITLIKNAGIVGAYSGYPVYAKLSEGAGKIKRILINCMESEPNITFGHRLLLERTNDVINGIKVLIKISGAYGAIIALDEKREALIKTLSESIADKNLIEVRALKSKYPQGDEHQLIYAVFNGVEMAYGKKPSDLGCLVFNPETAFNVFTSISTGVPVIKKLITVSGDAVASPANISVPIGTSFKDAINFCGGFTKEPDVIINGGPMTGTECGLDEVVTAYTRGITAMTGVKHETGDCVRCGRCVPVCPMRLLPPYLNDYARSENWDMCEKYGALHCIECGCCGYVCPAKSPVLDRIRKAKKEIMKSKIRKNEGKGE